MISWPLIIIGLMFNGQMSAMLINLGILLFSLAVLFQIVTLPVEFNASHRAVNVLETAGMLHPEEISGVKKVLGAAALTYVASAAAQIFTVITSSDPYKRTQRRLKCRTEMLEEKDGQTGQ